MAGPLDLMKKDHSAAFVLKDMGEEKEENMPEQMLDAATEEILDVLGLNHDKKDELQGALKNFMKACEYLEEEDDEEY